MNNFKLDFRTVGNIGTNCYLIINEELNKSIIVDPGDEAEVIRNMVDKSNSSPVALLLTHGHFDHIMAAERIKQIYGIKIYAGEYEKQVLMEESINLSSQVGNVKINVSADVWVKDGEMLNLAGFDIKAIHTPGHTEGGMSYYIESAGVLFSGDTLFCASVGRTDFPTGSMSQIVHSVKDKLLVLPDETIVFPGHGESTTVAYEKKYNPFCQ